jgi:hypothetical protein
MILTLFVNYYSTMAYNTVMVFLVGTCLGITISNLREDVLILPRKSNQITAFQVMVGLGEDPTSQLSVSIECSANASKGLTFKNTDMLICPSSTKKGNAAQINLFLSGIRLSLDAALDDLSIQYKITYYGQDIPEIKPLIIQNLKLATSIPVEIRGRVLDISKNNLGDEVKFLVASISKEYLVNSNQANLSLRFEDLLGKSDYEFVGADLYLMIPSRDLAEVPPKDLNFTIFDKTTGLESDSISLRVISKSPVKPAESKTNSEIYFLIFLGIFSVVIIAFIFIIYFTNKRANNHENLKESIDGQKRANQNTATTNQSFDGRTNVLSDSIINWNQKMIDGHKKKASVVLDMSDSKDYQSYKSADIKNNYQAFDESGRIDDSLSEHNSVVFQDISEIQQDNDSVKSHDVHQRSSFFEEF